MRADHRDAIEFGSIERELPLFVPEQHDALFRQFLGDLETAHDVNHTLDWRIVNHAAGKHGSQDAVDMVVQFRHRHFA